jgi:hypothetical protein
MWKQMKLQLGVYVALSTVVTSAQGAVDVAELLKGMIVASAEVRAVNSELDRNKQPVVVGDWEITHVFFGSNKLIGRHFKCNSYGLEGGTIADPTDSVFFKVGDRGLWLLGIMDGQLSQSRASWLPGDWPALESAVPADEYRRHQIIAKDFEDLQNVSPAKRTDVVVGKIQNDVNAGFWIRVLCETEDKSVVTLLRDIASKNPPRTEDALATIDEALARLDGRQWTDSSDRERFLSKIVTGSGDNDHEAEVLRGIASRQDLSVEKYIKLVSDAVRNSEWTTDARTAVLSYAAEFIKHDVVAADKVFSLYIETLQTASSTKVRRTAAECIRVCIKHTPAREAQVRPFLVNGEDAEVSRLLREWINPAPPPARRTGPKAAA